MSTLLNFNARAVAPEASRDPIPAGTYLCRIMESDVVTTKAGGQMLKLTHEVIDGPAKGRRVWGNINIQNSNPDAERIGQAQLSALCHAVNQLDLRDSAQLHNIPVRVRISVRPAGPDKNGVHRDAQNEVKGYEAAGNGATFTAPPAANQPPAQPAQPASPPWAKRA